MKKCYFNGGLSMAKYEVKDGKIIKMQTEHEECIYDKKTRAQIRKAGLKIYKDGKLWKE